MPVRSSICTYSPSLASSSSKYSTSGSSLSTGHYKPLSSIANPSASSTSSAIRASSSSSRYTPSSLSSSSSSSYSPAATYSTLPSSSLVSSPYSSATSSSHYRPLSSTHSSFNAGRHHLSTPISGSSTYGSNRDGRYLSSTGATSSSSSSLSSAGSSLLERTENLLGSLGSTSTSSGYSSPTIGSNLSNSSHRTYHPSPSSSRRRISRTSFDGSSSTDSSNLSIGLPQRHQAKQQQQLPSEVPRGLVNLGNTCYMNSAIQSLYSIEAFRNLILLNSSSYDKPLMMELCSLFKSMKDSNRIGGGTAISPRAFHNAFSRRHQSKFTEYHQQDAQEFLRYLINGVHEECNRAGKRSLRGGSRGSAMQPPKSAEEAWAQYREIVDDSPFVDLLVGQMCSTIVCSSCQNKSLCWDPFWDLSLPLQQQRSRSGSGSGSSYSYHYGSSSSSKSSVRLSNVLDDFCAKETLDSDERPICSQCKRATRSTKQIKLSRLPRLLILHLKKFSNDGYKLTSPEVRIDKTLTFNETIYCLSACISHHGHSASSGHYTNHCKYSTSWFHFNDDRVRDVTSSFDSANLEDAYVLFYTQQQSATIINQRSKL